MGYSFLSFLHTQPSSRFQDVWCSSQLPEKHCACSQVTNYPKGKCQCDRWPSSKICLPNDSPGPAGHPVGGHAGPHVLHHGSDQVLQRRCLKARRQGCLHRSHLCWIRWQGLLCKGGGIMTLLFYTLFYVISFTCPFLMYTINGK